MRLGILGGGSWGTALAIQWARKGHPVTQWARNSEDVAEFREKGCNTRYLPEVPFPKQLQVTDDLEKTLANSQLLCLCVPLQAYREFLGQLRPYLSAYHKLLLCSKGMEMDTYLLPSWIVVDVLGKDWEERTYALSGPSFAREVAEDKPTTVVLAGKDDKPLASLQLALSCPKFRMYRTHDIVGVELCGALKNIIAIASGMVDGLDLGYNTTAGLITRGLVEISRLGVALGAERETFSGLAGMGDLILTCTGSLSRNRRVGQALSEGKTMDQALADLGMVAEGVHTCRAAYDLSKKRGVELPITEAVYNILYKGLSPQKALHLLMTRDLKSEIEPLFP